MQIMNIEKFKRNANIETIQELMKSNNGYIKSKNITDLGIHRMYLKIMEDNHMIEKVGTGIYMDVNKMEDKYYVFSISTPNAIFSHMTALYFHNLSINAPTGNYDITVEKSYHNPKIRKHEIFYVSKDIYNMGICEVETPMGNKVKAYNIERCICDIIKSKKRMDIEHVKYSVKEYLKRSDSNLSKLSMYAEKMGIIEEVMNFVSVMYE